MCHGETDTQNDSGEGPWSPSSAEAVTEPVTHRCGYPIQSGSLNSVLTLHKGQALWRKEHQVDLPSQKTLLL